MNLRGSAAQIFLALLITGITVYFMVSLWKRSSNEGFKNKKKEGFGQREAFGPAVGAGIPDCLRDSQEASDVYDMFNSKSSSTEEGADDLRELSLILSKLCCFKKDLMSPSGIVEATRYQPYSTAHDLESVAETTARCLAKTIPPRDLDLAFEKWSTRGKQLLLRLCSSYNLSDAETKNVQYTFKKLIEDVNDVAKSQCLKGEVSIAGTNGPRDVTPYSPPELTELGNYKGYY